eukprot:COSAG05_NODE_775_length_7435_cov_3.124864_3_plen_96_part_00
MPALVKAWLHARGAGAEVTGGTAEETVAAVVEQLIVKAVAAEGTESSAQARPGTAPPQRLSSSSSVGTSGGAAKAGLAKFTREVEDQYRQRAVLS